MTCGAQTMAVDPVKRRAGLAAKKASPWRFMPVGTERGRESSEQYKANEERKAKKGGGREE